MQESITKQGILFIISAPSGAGKTSLVKALIERDPKLMVSVSHTTRPQRPGEKQGESYHFVDEATFEQMAADGVFLEYAKVFDHSYGTSRLWVEEQLRNGSDVVLEIDWQGAQQVRGAMSGTVSLFIIPPTLQALALRLNNRGEEESMVARRMRDAEQELSHYKEYDFLVINDDFNVALGDLEKIIRAMRHNYRLHGAYFDQYLAKLLAQTTKTG